MSQQRYPSDTDGFDTAEATPKAESDPTVEYVRRICGVKGTSDEPAFDESEYVRYLTVGRHKPVLPARRRSRSGDRVDEVF